MLLPPKMTHDRGGGGDLHFPHESMKSLPLVKRTFADSLFWSTSRSSTHCEVIIFVVKGMQFKELLFLPFPGFSFPFLFARGGGEGKGSITCNNLDLSRRRRADHRHSPVWRAAAEAETTHSVNNNIQEGEESDRRRGRSLSHPFGSPLPPLPGWPFDPPPSEGEKKKCHAKCK